MSIHTIGDSHSGGGWRGIVQHHLGPTLCYSFGKERLARLDIRQFNIQDGDTIVFSLGEIDCRCHVHKYVNETTTYQEVIDNIVNDYFDAIYVNLTTSQLKLKNVCVYNIVPPIQKHNTHENPLYPYLGSDEERKTYGLYFNELLKKKCAENKYIFFDIYDKYTDENGFLRKDLSDDNVHIRDGVYITEFMNKYLL